MLHTLTLTYVVRLFEVCSEMKILVRMDVCVCVCKGGGGIRGEDKKSQQQLCFKKKICQRTTYICTSSFLSQGLKLG